MIDPKVLDEIKAAPQSDQLTFILSWSARPQTDLAQDTMSRAERIKVFKDYYHDLKKEVIEAMHAIDGMRVLDLPGSGNAILTGTPDAWRSALPLIRGRFGVSLIPNGTVTSLT